jgi:hypothetical protein
LKTPQKFLVALLWLAVTSPAGWAQLIRSPYVVGVEAGVALPLGSLSDRVTTGWSRAIVVQPPSEDEPRWGVRLEMLSFTKGNADALVLKRKKEIAGVEQVFSLPLTGLEVSVEATGILATGAVPLLKGEFIEAEGAFGFGFYRWESVRGAFRDTLIADSLGTPVRLAILNVPENRQQEWSGGFELGADIRVLVAEPVWFSLGVRYKLIIGELWPALALDMENVSGMQMLDARLGFHARL